MSNSPLLRVLLFLGVGLFDIGQKCLEVARAFGRTRKYINSYYYKTAEIKQPLLSSLKAQGISVCDFILHTSYFSY
ncbi:MAG: hypothetical protein ACHBN1_17470 [Heteroscytonema crispum UTEX LB 1556]